MTNLPLGSSGKKRGGGEIDAIAPRWTGRGNRRGVVVGDDDEGMHEVGFYSPGEAIAAAEGQGAHGAW